MTKYPKWNVEVMIRLDLTNMWFVSDEIVDAMKKNNKNVWASGAGLGWRDLQIEANTRKEGQEIAKITRQIFRNNKVTKVDYEINITRVEE